MKILCNLLRKKNDNTKISTNYEAITPTGDIKNGKEYFYALDWALNNDDIRNIAVSGPYGSGKSSVIASYFSQKKEQNILKISLAAFNLETVDNHANDEIDKEKLEAGILKQLFYSVGAERIPHSRYRKLQVESSGKSAIQAMLAMIVLYAIFYFIFTNEPS